MKKIIHLLMMIVEKVEEYFIVWGLVAITILVFLQVVLRYVFHTGIFGTDEMSRFIFVFITWIGASIGIKEKEHIDISLLTDIFPKVRKYTDVFSTLVCLGMCLFLLVNGLDMVQIMIEKGQLSTALKVPMGAAYAIIPLSALLMGIKYIRQFIEEISLIVNRT